MDMFAAIAIKRRAIADLLGTLSGEQWDTQSGFALFSSRKTPAGLSFRATDIDQQSGSGPEVTGPARMLAHAMWGRPTALDELSGSGLDTLSTRLPAR